jgi:hypothetical protein
LRHLLGESVDQKLTGGLESLVGSCQASHASRKSVDHAFPYIEASIGCCRDRALNSCASAIPIWNWLHARSGVPGHSFLTIGSIGCSAVEQISVALTQHLFASTSIPNIHIG